MPGTRFPWNSPSRYVFNNTIAGIVLASKLKGKIIRYIEGKIFHQHERKFHNVILIMPENHPCGCGFSELLAVQVNQPRRHGLADLLYGSVRLKDFTMAFTTADFASRIVFYF